MARPFSWKPFAVAMGVTVAFGGAVLIGMLRDDPPPPKRPPAPVTPPRDAPPAEVRTGGVVLRSLNSGTDVAAEWNQIVEEIRLQPGAEFKVRDYERAQQLLARAAGTDDEAPLRENYEQMLRRRADRASEEFVASRARVEAFCRDRRYSDAYDEWELYPSALDEDGLFTALIPKEKQAVIDRAKRYHEALGTSRDALMEALRIGRACPQLAALDEDVRARLEALDRREGDAAVEVERAKMREYAAWLESKRKAETVDAALFDAAAQAPPEEAVELYVRLENADRWRAIRERARVQYERGEFAAAMHDLETLLDNDRIDAATVELLNRTYERGALASTAMQIYERTLARHPANGDLYVSLLRLAMQTHQSARAHELIDKAPRTMVHAEFPRLVRTLQTAESAFPGTPPAPYPFKRYVVVSDLDEAAKRRIAEFMAGVYEEYAVVFRYPKNETLKFYVKAFAKEVDFRTYYEAVTGASELGKSYRVEGFYDDTVKELVVYKTDKMWETMRHEGFHQYVDYFVKDCPTWFNEGYASYFETSTADGPRDNPSRAAAVADGLARDLLPPLKDLLLMKAETFRSHPYSAHLYAQSWSFIYFLIVSGRKDVLDRYFEALMRGRDLRQAYDEAFEGRGLEDEWLRAVRG